MGIQAADIKDLIQAALPHLGQHKITDLGNTYQHLEFWSRIMRQKKVLLRTGPSIKRNVVVGYQGTARNTTLFATSSYGARDVLKQIEVPWRHANVNWMYERREVAMNRPGPQEILDEIEIRRQTALGDFAELVERNFFGKPEDSSDEETPWGLLYWLVTDSTTGFTGGSPTGFSDVAGLSPTTYPRWKNYAGEWTEYSRDDLLELMKRLATETMWRSPLSHAKYEAAEQRFAIYMGLETKLKLEKITEGQNDSLGKDHYPYRVGQGGGGNTMFMGHEYVYVPYMNEFADEEIIFCDWATFELYGLKGEFLNEQEPRISPDSESTIVCDMDTSCNLVCHNRSRNGRIKKAA